MEIQTLREAFSKGAVAVNQNNIAVVYTFNDRWFAQSVNHNVLEELLSKSNSVIIKSDVGKSIKILFNGDFGFDPMVFGVLSPELTSKEMDDLIDKLDEKISPEALEIFKDVNLDNEYEMIEAVKELIERKRKDIRGSIPFSSIMNWPAMIKAIDGMKAFSDMYETQVTEPDGDFGGCIEFIFYDHPKRPIVLISELKEIASRLTQISQDVTIEGNVNTGQFNITFFA